MPVQPEAAQVDDFAAFDHPGGANWRWRGVITDTQCNSHGTHCASTAAGKNYGIAPSANVYGMKVLPYWRERAMIQGRSTWATLGFGLLG